MGGVVNAITGKDAKKARNEARYQEEQARLRAEQQRRIQERQQAEQKAHNEKMLAEQEAKNNRAELQAQLEKDKASNASDDSAEFKVGVDTGGTNRKRVRKSLSSTLGVG